MLSVRLLNEVHRVLRDYLSNRDLLALLNDLYHVGRSHQSFVRSVEALILKVQLEAEEVRR